MNSLVVAAIIVGFVLGSLFVLSIVGYLFHQFLMSFWNR